MTVLRAGPSTWRVTRSSKAVEVAIGFVAALMVAMAAPAQTPAAGDPAAGADASAIVVTARAKLRVGMNLSPISPVSSAQPFIDRTKEMEWRSNEWGDLPPGTTDATGFPNKPGTSYKSSTVLEAGKYLILYTGSSAISIYQSEQGDKHGNIITWGPGISYFEYTKRGRITFNATGGPANLQISGLDPADPMRDFHIIRADQEKLWRAGAIINPEYAAFLRPFSPLRTMDWNGTNGSQVVHWADRSKPEWSHWGMVPIEAQIALANANGADLWLNVPHLADDDYVRQLATLVKAQLAPKLKLHLEYSNEVWNNQFDQTKYAQAEADRLWGGGKPVQWGNSVFYGYRAAQIMAIARDVLDDRLSGVLGTWPGWANSEVDDAIASGVRKAGKGDIGELFREYAITTYFGNGLSYGIGNEPDRPVTLAWAQGGAAGLDKAFAELEHGGTLQSNSSLDALRRAYVRHAAQAKAWGLNLVAYEGGIHVFNFMAPDPEKGVRVDLLKHLVADPRMGDAYRRMAADFAAAGGTALVHFTDIGEQSIWGAWGVAPDLKTSTPRLEALRSVAGH